ncbi:MAG: 16S rRNA processing protein RimM [Bacteroidales bacterium]|nr:16S rRNA processing protein RimM [Bacteroidales bacterium]
MITSKDILLIGTIARTHGKQGELQVRTVNEYWDDSDADFLILMLDAIPVPFRVLEWRVKGADLLFTLQDIATEQDALRLVGSEVYMLRRDIATTDDNTILCWQDIIGYSVQGCAIVAIDDTTSNVLATLSDGRLIPLHEDLITAINHDTKTITMNLPEGL